MTDDVWHLRVTDSKGLVHEADLSGPAEIGRQQKREEQVPGHFQIATGWRVVIAPLDEVTVSRKHLEVKPLGAGRFFVKNLSDKQIVSLAGRNLSPGESSEFMLPVMIRLGNKTLRLQSPEEEEAIDHLPMATMAPGMASLLPSMKESFARSSGPGMEPDVLLGWIEAFLGLLQSAAGSADFFVKAARALVDMVKLDSGRVLIRAGDKWQEQAVESRRTAPGQDEWRASSRVLGSVLKDKRTTWQVPRQDGASIQGIDAVVAAPILDRKGDVIGALYGERRADSGAGGRRPISRLEAMLVEVLASGVAAGLARVEQENAALRARLQMEECFGQRVAARMVDHPELLHGRDTAVTILFCDIRGFSRISEKLGPAQTVAWIADVMGDLSECVLAHEGVVVDYIGDELMAMWGAPEDQPGHPSLACASALAMLERLPRLNERWQSILGEPLSVGIGINTGIAQVGNIGSRNKFKYGALGNTVNLASRVQGATKHLKVRLLITESTRAGLGEPFAIRSLCQVRVVNIAQPVTLFELAQATDPGWASLKRDYEQALADFTKGDFRAACRTIGQLITEHPEDGPALILLARAVGCLVEEPEAFDPVMVLPGK